MSLVVIIVANVRAEENVSAEIDASQKIKQEVKKYKKECSKKAYPDDYMDHVYAFADDSLKYNKIIFPKKESEKMIQFLNEWEISMGYSFLYLNSLEGRCPPPLKNLSVGKTFVAIMRRKAAGRSFSCRIDS